MKIPTITGIIDRRILVNFTVDMAIAKSIVPAPFTPKLYEGKAIAGICLIRLKNVRPKGLPGFIGIGSENGAHRIAVEWEEDGLVKEGVYIPRRDTSSLINTLAGGKIFPGKHYKAKFDVKEDNNNYHVAFVSSDGTSISVDAKTTSQLNEDSIFKKLESASSFFEKGAAGYSPNGQKYEGLLLTTHRWEMKPLEVTSVKSTFFEDETIFPKGSVKFDNALLMTDISHEWSSLTNKSCY
ncbi:DUF2071 domain-containing protein [Mucilaginibacter ginsenosidivorans]|uniref:DUF2071 domain-containing protein n=1 Tax=Mucilaginibacter ginsenosidivorans TaxID=398053 RepID=A0A5B8UUJ6_9SPHI|nr:DUF2071 domain-containing protein [Mucilaginibacter ginsenosidivorans]QEC62613.1 hypothetical protein FRZ54_08440 [Mucilaginibacter ginsenosidivorans]